MLDIPPFLVALLRWAVKNRLRSCSCPLLDDGRPVSVCKGDDPEREGFYDPTPANYLFLGPRGGHPRRSNYADDFLTPAAEGLHPQRDGARRPVYVKAEPWPGIPIRKGNRKTQGRRPSGRHLAEPHRQGQTTRLPAHARDDPGELGRQEGASDGSPGPCPGGNGLCLRPRDGRDAAALVRCPRRTLVDGDRGALPDGTPVRRRDPRRHLALLRPDEHRLAGFCPPNCPPRRQEALPQTGERAFELRAPLRNRTVDLLLTMETLCRLS